MFQSREERKKGAGGVRERKKKGAVLKSGLRREMLHLKNV